MPGARPPHRSVAPTLVPAWPVHCSGDPALSACLLRRSASLVLGRSCLYWLSPTDDCPVWRSDAPALSSGARPLFCSVCPSTVWMLQRSAPTTLWRLGCPTLGHFSNIVHDLSKAWPRWRSGSPGSVASVHATSPPAVLRRSATPALGRSGPRLLRCLTSPALGGSELFRSSSLDPTRSSSAQLSVSLVHGYPDAPPVQCAILGWWAVLALGSSGTFGDIRRFLFISIHLLLMLFCSLLL